MKLIDLCPFTYDFTGISENFISTEATSLSLTIPPSFKLDWTTIFFISSAVLFLLFDLIIISSFLVLITPPEISIFDFLIFEDIISKFKLCLKSSFSSNSTDIIIGE